VPTPSRSILREVLINAAIVLVTVGLIYAAAEAYVGLTADDGMEYDLEMWRYARDVKRVSADPAIGHEHRPNAQARLMGVDVRTNADGLRDRDYSFERKPGTTRILMLGDSLTFGWGVPAEATYSKRLERSLNAAGLAVEVINTGVGNYNTAMEVAYFLERGIRYKPDIVVLNYFINDAEPVPGYDTNILSRNLRAYVYFAARLGLALRQLDAAGMTDWHDYYRSLYDEARNPGGFAAVEAAVARLAAYCREHGIALHLVNYPELRTLDPYPFAAVDARLAALAARHGLPFLNLLDAVRGQEPAALWVTPPDPHPSALAHDLFAQALHRYFLPILSKPAPATKAAP